MLYVESSPSSMCLAKIDQLINNFFHILSTYQIFCNNFVCVSNRKIDVKCFPSPDALNPCEDVMGSQWLRTSVWIVVLLAVFGNIAVLLVLFSNW